MSDTENNENNEETTESNDLSSSEAIDLNLDNYSLYDLLELFGVSMSQPLKYNELDMAISTLKETVSKGDIGNTGDGGEDIANILETKDKIIEFIDKAGKRMIEIIESVNQADPDARRQSTRTSNVDLKTLSIPESDIYKNIKKEYCVYNTLDSQFRDNLEDTTSSYTGDLANDMVDVTAIAIVAGQIPLTWYTIDSNKGNNYFYIGIVEHTLATDPSNNEVDTTDIEDINVIHNQVYSRGDYIQALIADMEALTGIIDNGELDSATRESKCREIRTRNNYDASGLETAPDTVVWRKVVIDDGNYTHLELTEEIQEKINAVTSDILNQDGDLIIDLSDPDETNHKKISVTYDTKKHRIQIANKLNRTDSAGEPILRYSVVVRFYDRYGNEFTATTENTCLGYLMGWRHSALISFIAIQILQFRIGLGEGAVVKDGDVVTGNTTPNTHGPKAVYVGVDDYTNYSRSSHIGTTFRDNLGGEKTDCYIKEFIQRKIQLQTRSAVVGEDGDGGDIGNSGFRVESDQFIVTNGVQTGMNRDFSSNFTPKHQEAVELKLAQLSKIVENKRKNGNLDNVCLECPKPDKDRDPGKIMAKISVDVPPVAVKELGYVKYRDFNSGREAGSFERRYIGPVSLSRMKVFLMDEYGCRIDLNDHDMSVTVKICRNRVG